MPRVFGSRALREFHVPGHNSQRSGSWSRSGSWRSASAGMLALLGLLCGASPLRAGGVEGYELGAQDRIRINVIEWLNGSGELRSPVNGEYTVGPTGFLSIPLIGDIRATGVQANALASEISQRIQTKLALSERPLASVEIVQFRPFFIMGDVERPNEYAFRPGLTVLRAVSIAGGYFRPPGRSQDVAGREFSQATSERRTAMARIVELQARRARLDAELKDAEKFEYPPELAARAGEAEIASLMELEATVFEARKRAFRAAFDGQLRLVNLYDQETLAMAAQGESLKRHEEATRRQGENLRSLQSKGLATMGREYDIDRMLAEVLVRQQELGARSIKLQQDRVRAEDAVQQAEARRKQEIATELQGLQATLDDLDQRLLLADRTLSSSDPILNGQRPAFKLLRQDRSSGSETEFSADGSTQLRPGDVLVVQVGHSVPPQLSDGKPTKVLVDVVSR